VLDACPAAAMAAPGKISEDPVAAEDRDAKARDAAVPAVGEDALVLEAERLDLRATEVNGVVTVARTAGRRGNDTTVAGAHGGGVGEAAAAGEPPPAGGPRG
jgi:hypothetical protein